MSKQEDIDEKFMSVALKLARKGIYSVEPNPAVGAVLVKDNKIIGKGYHREFSSAHAEINAINNAIKKGNIPKGATLYVTLEPCCHYGKTPPCTQAIIKAGIKKVIIAALDPSDKVAGKGVRLLKKSGIIVKTGLMSQQARELNSWFYKFHCESRPWVICKWAQTIDGKLAARSGHSKWISSREARIEAHKLRRSCQAIVVGVNTVNADNPKLTIRNVPKTAQPAPARVILDSKLRIKTSADIISSAVRVPTFIVTTESTVSVNGLKMKRLEKAGVKLIPLTTDDNGKIDLLSFLKFAVDQNWHRIMIEGGATLLSSFLAKKLADELRIFIAPKFALDKRAKQFWGISPELADDFLADYKIIESRKLQDDLILALWRK